MDNPEERELSVTYAEREAARRQAIYDDYRKLLDRKWTDLMFARTQLRAARERLAESQSSNQQPAHDVARSA
jgi:hypothetical protein